MERLAKPIIDKKRRFELNVIEQVSRTLDQLIKEEIIEEAFDPKVASNLLPVEKSLREKSLSSKIDKYLDRQHNKETNKTCVVTDVRILNSLLPTPQALQLPKLNEIKTSLIDHHFGHH